MASRRLVRPSATTSSAKVVTLKVAGTVRSSSTFRRGRKPGGVRRGGRGGSPTSRRIQERVVMGVSLKGWIKCLTREGSGGRARRATLARRASAVAMPGFEGGGKRLPRLRDNLKMGPVYGQRCAVLF